MDMVMNGVDIASIRMKQHHKVFSSLFVFDQCILLDRVYSHNTDVHYSHGRYCCCWSFGLLSENGNATVLLDGDDCKKEENEIAIENNGEIDDENGLFL